MTLQIMRDGVIVQSIALAEHTAGMHVGSAARAAADGVASLDASGDVPLAQVPDTLTGKDADTVDGEEAADIVTDARVKAHFPDTLAAVLSDHDKAAHDALNINADQVDGEHAADIVTNARVKAHFPDIIGNVLTDHNKADHDLLNINADQVDGKEAADFEEVANKGAANGYAGLDSNIFLSPLIIPVFENYSNHLGAVDTFTQTVLSGNGSATPDSVNHEMDLYTGINAISYSIFETKKAYPIGSVPLIANFILANLPVDYNSVNKCYVGFKSDFTNHSLSASHAAFFIYNATWLMITGDGSSNGSSSVSISSGDLLSIVLTSSYAKFFVNGELIQTRTTTLPVGNVKIGAVVHQTSSSGTGRSISIDYLEVKSHKI